MTTDELNRAFNKPKFEKCVYGDSDLNELKERLRFRIPPNEREDIIEQLRKMCANKSFEQKEQDTVNVQSNRCMKNIYINFHLVFADRMAGL